MKDRVFTRLKPAPNQTFRRRGSAARIASLILLFWLMPLLAQAQLAQVYEASGRIELQAIGADVVVHADGPGWHESTDPRANDGNDFVNYDIDNSLGLAGAGATFNSSSVDYGLASGKRIIKAVLVWGAKVDDGFDDGSGAQQQVQLYVRESSDVPNGSYVAVTADGGGYEGPIGGGGTAFDVYGYYADVTQYFSGLAAGSTYKIVVADVEARLDSVILGGAAAGWALHLVLDNPALTDEYYIAVYGGLQVVNPNQTIDTPITGLNIPLSTLGETYIASSALDGDVGRPDTYRFGPAGGPYGQLSDGLHPADDFHNARRSYEAAFYDTNPGPIVGSAPNYDKVTHDLVQLAPDASFNLPGGTTDALVRLTTSTGEGINLTSFALATPNNAPLLSLIKEASAVNGGPVTAVSPGDRITYTLTVQNDALARASAVEIVVEDNLPAGVTYVAGSTVAQGPVLTLSTGTYLDNFDTPSYSNSNGSETWSSSWDETGDNDNPASGRISINSAGRLQFRNLDSATIERTVDLGGASSVTLTFDWQEVSGNEDVGVDLWNGRTSRWDRVGETGAGAGAFTYALNSDQISSNSAIRFATGSGGWSNSERVDLDNVQFSVTTTSGPSVVTKDNDPSGSNDLTDGDPAGQLVAAADYFFLEAGASMTVTFDVTVDDVPCTTLNNVANASASGLATPVGGSALLSCAPTAVTIDAVELEAIPVGAVLAGLGTNGDPDGLLQLLRSFDPQLAEALTGAPADRVEAALIEYLDPDGDGQTAILRWQTLQERGTIGFYVDRRQVDAGTWERVNGGMLPGLIDAPLGGDYWLMDPGALPGETYLYRLIELEAWGTQRHYGPWRLSLE